MSQKIENQLNLALDITEEERQKSESLDIGYDQEEKECELIVKYSETLERVRTRAVYVTELTGGYAIIQIKESQIKELAAFPEVEFIEKPKSLYFQVENGRRVSCNFSSPEKHSITSCAVAFLLVPESEDLNL